MALFYGHFVMTSDLLQQIIAVRLALRQHRDQVGDYRCWVDDEVLYHETLPELKDQLPVLPDSQTFSDNCANYFFKRQNPKDAEVVNIPLDSSVGPLQLNYPEELDEDLKRLSDVELSEKLDQSLNGIRQHRAISCAERTYQDDIALSQLLPEQILPITKLPNHDDFLGKNCPAYNAHCQRNPQEFVKGIWNK